MVRAISMSAMAVGTTGAARRQTKTSANSRKVAKIFAILAPRTAVVFDSSKHQL
jgi:hypothetical protein